MRFHFALVFMLALGCGGTTTGAPATDAGSTDTSVATDVASAVEAASDSVSDATCDVGPVPPPTPFAGSGVFVDSDAGVTFPVPTGGDAKGEWRWVKVTIYVSESARDLIDLSKSTVTGHGFNSYTATTFRSSSEVNLSLNTSVAGVVKRANVTKGKGTWKMEGNEIVNAPECSESTEKRERVSWSRIDEDHARLQFKPAPTGFGDFIQQFVIDLERIK